MVIIHNITFHNSKLEGGFSAGFEEINSLKWVGLEDRL